MRSNGNKPFVHSLDRGRTLNEALHYPLAFKINNKPFRVPKPDALLQANGEKVTPDHYMGYGIARHGCEDTNKCTPPEKNTRISGNPDI
jgi:hypothetical protein